MDSTVKYKNDYSSKEPRNYYDSLDCYQNKYITILSVQILDAIIIPSSLHHHQLLQTWRVGSMNVQLKLPREYVHSLPEVYNKSTDM